MTTSATALVVSRYHCDTHDHPVIYFSRASSSIADPTTNAGMAPPPASCKERARGCRLRHVVTDSSLVHVEEGGSVTRTPA